MEVIILTESGRVVGKTNHLLVLQALGQEFSIIPFDGTNDSHKKAKFLTEPPIPFTSVVKERVENSALNWLIELSKFCGEFCSLETKGKKASNSELRRWLENKTVIVNGESLEWNEPMDFPVFSVVLFPNSVQRRCTLL